MKTTVKEKVANKIMRYENKKLARKTITFRSNYGHFWG